MSDYPEKTCSIDRLLTHEKLIEAAVAGRKTEQRRAGVYAYPGESFEAGGQTFVVKGLHQERYGDMTEANAQAEGYPSLIMYKELIKRVHGGTDMDDDQIVWVHQFEKADA
jgi:hypothetical protein